MTTLEILKAAKERLKNIGWCRGVYAIRSDGTATIGSDPECASFCMVGAMQGMGWYEPAKSVLSKCLPEGVANIASFNDNIAKSVDDVLDVYDAAIESEQEQLGAVHEC